MDFYHSALLSIVEALLLHGETGPLTGLPARATSAVPIFSGGGGGNGRVAVSGQTPKSTKGLACDARAPLSGAHG